MIVPYETKPELLFRSGSPWLRFGVALSGAIVGGLGYLFDVHAATILGSCLVLFFSLPGAYDHYLLEQNRGILIVESRFFRTIESRTEYDL